MHAQVRDALAELGLDHLEVRLREVEDEEAAEREGFLGSPTLRVHGQDLFAPPPGEPPALTCRVYRLPDGRHSPIPDPADVRERLRRALTETRSDS
jgi:hypothetical protein